MLIYGSTSQTIYGHDWNEPHIMCASAVRNGGWKRRNPLRWWGTALEVWFSRAWWSRPGDTPRFPRGPRRMSRPGAFAPPAKRFWRKSTVQFSTAPRTRDPMLQLWLRTFRRSRRFQRWRSSSRTSSPSRPTWSFSRLNSKMLLDKTSAFLLSLKDGPSAFCVGYNRY
jgi:hypothetical protein